MKRTLLLIAVAMTVLGGPAAANSTDTGPSFCREVIVQRIDDSNPDHLLVQCEASFSDGSVEQVELRPSHHSNPAAICGVWGAESWNCPFFIALQK